MIRFVFDERKTAQAAAYLVFLKGGQMNYMALIKLLYLADRQSLQDIGLPITGDRMVSMPHGPVLSNTLDIIKGQPTDGLLFHEYLQRSGYDVEAKQAFETDELSQFELETLKAVYEKYGHLNQWGLEDLTHALPEWIDPDGSSFPVDVTAILKDSGRSTEEIEELEREADEVWFMRTLESARA